MVEHDRKDDNQPNRVRSGSARLGRSIPPGPAGQRPEHPNGAAALLMVGVVLLLFAIAAVSTFAGR